MWTKLTKKSEFIQCSKFIVNFVLSDNSAFVGWNWKRFWQFGPHFVTLVFHLSCRKGILNKFTNNAAILLWTVTCQGFLSCGRPRCYFTYIMNPKVIASACAFLAHTGAHQMENLFIKMRTKIPIGFISEVLNLISPSFPLPASCLFYIYRW